MTFEFSSNSGVDYQYYMEEKKKVPKNDQLGESLIVKSVDFTSNANIHGKRIVICGATDKDKLFFAIYNTAYNLTEYLHEDGTTGSSGEKESCKSVEINENTGHLLILVQETSNLGTSVLAKAFSLESNAKCEHRNGDGLGEKNRYGNLRKRLPLF